MHANIVRCFTFDLEDKHVMCNKNCAPGNYFAVNLTLSKLFGVILNNNNLKVDECVIKAKRKWHVKLVYFTTMIHRI